MKNIYVYFQFSSVQVKCEIVFPFKDLTIWRGIAMAVTSNIEQKTQLIPDLGGRDSQPRALDERGVQ